MADKTDKVRIKAKTRFNNHNPGDVFSVNPADAHVWVGKKLAEFVDKKEAKAAAAAHAEVMAKKAPPVDKNVAAPDADKGEKAPAADK